MSLTINLKTYDPDTPRGVDGYRYNGPDHNLADSDYVDLKRTAPKPTAYYAGQAKSSVKLTRSLESSVTAGTMVGKGIMEVTFSVPAESTAVDQQAMITDLAAWLATAAATSALMDHDINQ